MESSLAENTAEAVERLKPEITITVTAAIKVPHTYIYLVESNTAYIREQVEELATGLEGSVYAVDIS